MPFVHRTSNGNRSFSDEDLEWISIICCLKGTGMSVKQIREYIALCLQGDETLEQRRQIFVEQKESVLRQIEELNKHLEKVNHKLKIYEKACEEYRRKKGRK